MWMVLPTDALGFGTTAMTLPTADGTNGQVLKTDGAVLFLGLQMAAVQERHNK